MQKNIFAPFNLDPVIWDLGGDKTKLCACNPLFCCILTVIHCSSNDLARRTKWGQVYVEGIICPPPMAPVVESELRWQFCGHGSACPEIYF